MTDRYLAKKAQFDVHYFVLDCDKDKPVLEAYSNYRVKTFKYQEAAQYFAEKLNKENNEQQV